MPPRVTTVLCLLAAACGACSSRAPAAAASAHAAPPLPEAAAPLTIEFPFAPPPAAPAAGWTAAHDDGAKGVYLTYDDGPKPSTTMRLLDILDGQQVKATFFLIGRKAVKHPEVVREIVARGHEIGNHSYDHKMEWGMKTSALVADALEGKAALEEIAGRPVPLYRPPGGSLRLAAACDSLGMKFVAWTASIGDCASKKGPASLVKLFKKQEEARVLFHNPLIILMHDTNTRTVDAAPKLVALLRSKGYDFLSEWY